MKYSFEPIVDSDCKILILGSMPGEESLSKGQYYANARNNFWRLLYDVFGYKSGEEYQEKLAYLLTNHIALWDTIESCEREGSLDSSIKNVKTNDFIDLFIEYKNIKAIFFNGGASEKLFTRYVKPNIYDRDIKYYKLPSSSPANNTISYEKKLDEWKRIKNVLDGMLT